MRVGSGAGVGCGSGAGGFGGGGVGGGGAGGVGGFAVGGDGEVERVLAGQRWREGDVERARADGARRA
ncbi:MAG: hypothetical protein ACK6D2_03225, partial [Planctomycetota bacterium]